MKLSTIFHSVAYILSLCSAMILTKALNYWCNYDDYWYTVVLYVTLAPLNIIPCMIFNKVQKENPSSKAVSDGNSTDGDVELHTFVEHGSDDEIIDDSTHPLTHNHQNSSTTDTDDSVAINMEHRHVHSSKADSETHRKASSGKKEEVVEYETIQFDFNIYIYFIIPAVIYSIECIAVAFVLNNMNLALYVIARTSTSIFNYFSYRYILNRELNMYYYLGIALLCISYIFIILEFGSEQSLYGMLMFVVGLGTGLTTSLYNTIGELQLTNKKITPRLKLPYTMLNNFIFQMTAITLDLPVGLALIDLAEVFRQLQTSRTFVIITIIAAIGYQINTFHKFFILNDPTINSSMVISTLDLVRRISTNIASYTLLGEHYTIYGIWGNVFLILASISLFASSNNVADLTKIGSSSSVNSQPK
jgi:hypothetical protein